MADKALLEKSIAAIRARLRTQALVCEDGEFRQSFSFGLAQFPQDGSDLDALTAVADKRLYAMKSAHP